MPDVNITNMSRTKKIVIMGLAAAIMVCIGKFSIHINLFGFTAIKVGFGFVITFLISTQIDPISGALVAAVADVVHSLLFPIGPYFPGFTLTSFLSGLLVGYLYRAMIKICKGKVTFVSCFIPTVITKVFIAVLNTVWLWLLFSKTPFLILLGHRVVVDFLVGVILSPICFYLTKYSKHIIQ